MQDLIDDLDEHDDQEPETKGRRRERRDSALTERAGPAETPSPWESGGGRSAARLAGPCAGAVHRRPRPAGRSRRQHAVAVTAQERSDGPRATARSSLPHEDRRAGRRRRRNGVPLLSGDRRHSLAPPLPPPPPSPAAPECSVCWSGCGRPEQAILTDDRLRAAVGADVYTSSLREAVEACLEAARAEIPPVAA